MKITISEKAPANAHVNPPLYFGDFYKILRRKDGIPVEKGYGTVFQVSVNSVTYFYEDGSVTHSNKEYPKTTYEFEKFVGTITIECP